MKSRLKHCPFCGGVATLDKLTYEPHEEVSCSRCGATGPSDAPLSQKKGQASRGWNRRAKEPKLPKTTRL
jgi:Lar family restriction alleviation protein